jgi:FAD/FMN-containing dehydrogenase
MARPTIGHLDPAFVGMMNETKEGLKTIFKTENELGNVLTGEENTRPFECDGLSVYRQKPLAVVLPQSVEQIKQVLKI